MSGLILTHMQKREILIMLNFVLDAERNFEGQLDDIGFFGAWSLDSAAANGTYSLQHSKLGETVI
jgi:hypothetical protein